jgi:DNA-directed RNA polymerase subunit RPC12/RpoP
MPAKIAVLDIERQSGLVDGIWGLKQNGWLRPSQVIEPPRTICFAYKWVGAEKVHFHSEWEDGHRSMIEKAHKVFEDADFIVGWNSKGFDVKHLRTEMAVYEMKPPSPHKDVDLLLTARKNFAFLSNRLAFVAESLGLDGKMETGGESLWRTLRFGAGEELWDARRLMMEYNVRDVELTEELWHALKPWVSGVNVALFEEDSGNPRCSNCGSDSVQWRGEQVSLSRAYKRFRCRECGRWGRMVKSSRSVASTGL